MQSIDFIGVGPQRTASSWLHEVLAQHSEIVLPEHVKETMFFDLHYEKGVNWYFWHFGSRGRGHVYGEIGPTYFHCPSAAERIRQLAPEARVIINVRNPIEQSHSLFRHHYSKGRVPNDFFAATRRIPAILTAAQYSRYTPIWEDCFPDRVLFLVQEDIRTNPQHVWDCVCVHLGVSRCELPRVGRQTINSAGRRRSGRRWQKHCPQRPACYVVFASIEPLISESGLVSKRSSVVVGQSIGLIRKRFVFFATILRQTSIGLRKS